MAMATETEMGTAMGTEMEMATATATETEMATATETEMATATETEMATETATRMEIETVTVPGRSRCCRATALDCSTWLPPHPGRISAFREFFPTNHDR